MGADGVNRVLLPSLDPPKKPRYRKYVIRYRKDGVGRWVHSEVTVAGISIIALSIGPPIGAASGGAGRRFFPHRPFQSLGSAQIAGPSS